MDTNNNHSIELQVVQGETSGLFKINAATGSVEFSEDISFEQWREVLRLAKTIKRKAAVIVADCIIFGTPKWGSKAVDEALEQLEFESILVKNAVAVTCIPRNMRYPHLDPDHYSELFRSKLSKKDKIKWAKIASDQHLSPSQLRISMLQGEVVDPAAIKESNTGVTTIHGIRQDFDVWMRRVHGIDGVKSMDPEMKLEILEELKAIVEFGMLLNEHVATLREVTVA